MASHPEYRSVLAADIAGSAGRGDRALRDIRAVLFTALRAAMERSEIDWTACSRHDMGDGIRLIMPPGTPKTRLLHPLGYELAVRLRAHNNGAAPLAQVRIRLALHAGDVHVGSDGTTVGHPLEVVARLLDAPPARQALAADPALPLAVIVSPHFYDETVPQGYPGIDRESFRRVAVTVKEFAGEAWLWLPLAPGPASPQPEPRPSGLPAPPAPQPGISAGRDLTGVAVIGNGNVIRAGQETGRQP